VWLRSSDLDYTSIEDAPDEKSIAEQSTSQFEGGEIAIALDWSALVAVILVAFCIHLVRTSFSSLERAH
jgi:hypothetical protein